MSDVSGAAATTEIRVTVRSPGSGTVVATAAVPAGATQTSGLVPALHRVCDALVAERAAATLCDGTEISCHPGCGACCRQLVPILDAEAEYLAGTVAAMPAERRRTVLARWQRVLGVLEGRGVLERLCRFRRLTRQERRDLVTAYFRLGLDCPFLEDESCSVYADRPLACREYLVTSPPEACRGFGDVPVDKVPMPNSLFNRLLATDADGTGWAPLVLALDPAAPQATLLADNGDDIVSIVRKNGGRGQKVGRGVEVLAEMLGAEVVQSDDSRAR